MPNAGRGFTVAEIRLNVLERDQDRRISFSHTGLLPEYAELSRKRRNCRRLTLNPLFGDWLCSKNPATGTETKADLATSQYVWIGSNPVSLRTRRRFPLLLED